MTSPNDNSHNLHNNSPEELGERVRGWALELGFQQIGFSKPELATAEQHLTNWLAAGRHGDMHYMAKHGLKRSRPAELVPGTLNIISVRINYLPDEAIDPKALLEDSPKAYISRYALGRDYHKLVRRRLQQLADKITEHCGEFGYRAFVDSAPVLEKALAEKAGLGWIGKHTNIINKDAGSWFFLGELFTDLPLPSNEAPKSNHCGSCNACIDVCPTQAIIAPYQLDARRCISYLTIEMQDSIPLEFRKAIGNRIYGCDDCQLFCPWNKFAQPTNETDFSPRHGLNDIELCELFKWNKATWLERMAGSAIRRIGYEAWLRNIAIALGNVSAEDKANVNRAIAALRSREADDSELVREHVAWALHQHGEQPHVN
ncbi:MAG: tRNA epoxyqueuosine(34) reductase QueG [Gammaproteobacteria bacterium]|jgi:epoxyqueuosine reductase|nr:tRNA epoxyqueuosine(34) reductase QueG [Gammaproteobacteria bacterium]